MREDNFKNILYMILLFSLIWIGYVAYTSYKYNNPNLIEDKIEKDKETLDSLNKDRSELEAISDTLYINYDNYTQKQNESIRNAYLVDTINDDSLLYIDTKRRINK